MVAGDDVTAARAVQVRRLAAALALAGAFFVVELATALATNSLALLSDAFHMLTDVLGLGMALAAAGVAQRSNGDVQRTFGLYRLEILAALANAVLLSGVAVYVVVEAIRRFGQPPEVASTPMLVVAVLGLVVNLVAFALLRRGAHGNLNIAAAYWEVAADTVGSIGVIAAAVVLMTTGFALIDPIVAVAIGVLVLPRTYRIARQALRILVQAAPPHVDTAAVRDRLAAVGGVVGLHDLHLWTLTSGMEVGSVHLLVGRGADSHAVLDRARAVLRDDFGVVHATVQVEPADHATCRDCDQVSW